MSFTGEIKNELLNLKNNDTCCDIAELSAIAHTCGSIELSNTGKLFLLTSENIQLIYYVDEMIKTLFSVKNEIEEEDKPNGKTAYTLVLKENAETIMREIGILSDDGICFGINKYIIEQECCKVSYIRGVFLGCGTVSVPDAKNKNGYHLEFSFSNTFIAGDFNNLLFDFGFYPKVVQRKKNTIIYFKENETITDLLAFIGASDGVLKMSDIVVERSMRNIINRRTNTDFANISKQVDAAQKQISAINRIDETVGIFSLSEKLQEIAKVRLENPLVDLEELGKLVNPPISKSGVNHRLRKIIEYSKNLK